jgi:hypothetical protein
MTDVSKLYPPTWVSFSLERTNLRAKFLASIRSQPAAVKLNWKWKKKMKQNKEADPPDNASLYRFLSQQKIRAMLEGSSSSTFISPGYHIILRLMPHLVASLRKGSSQLLPVWPK